MKKTNVVKMMIVIILMFALIKTSFALGITPSKVNIDFNADLQQEGSFKVLNEQERDTNIIVYPRGELAQYVLIEKNTLHISPDQKETEIRYKMNVPYSARKPGPNVIDIVVEEVADNYDQQTVIGGRLALVHQIILKSPYTGKYARLMLTASNYEYGKNTDLTYTLFSEGTEDISSTKLEVDMYNSNFDLVGQETYDTTGLAAGEIRKEVKTFTKPLSPGKYYAKARLLYDGKIAASETSFEIGGSEIEIGGIASPEFKRGKINRFDVSIFNKAQRDISNVFAEVIVKDKQDKVLNIFKTVSIDVPQSSGNTLYGFWDTKNLFPDVYYLLVKLRYEDKAIDKEYEVAVRDEELVVSGEKISGNVVSTEPKSNSSMIPILIVSFLVLMIVNIAMIIYIRKGKTPPPPLNNSQLINMVLFVNIFAMGMILKINRIA